HQILTSFPTRRSSDLVAKDNLNNAKERIKTVSIDLLLSDTFKQAHEKTVLEVVGEEEIFVISVINEARKAIEEFKKQVLLCAESKEIKNLNIVFNSKISPWLSGSVENNTENIAALNEDNAKKNEKILTLEKEINTLLENKSISEQKVEIEKWINIDKQEKSIRKKESEINTSPVTNLS